jgi:hypothetical protein
MVEPLRHRQTKEAATDMFSLQPPRHIPTLPVPSFSSFSAFPVLEKADVAADLVEPYRMTHSGLAAKKVDAAQHS